MDVPSEILEAATHGASQVVAAYLEDEEATVEDVVNLVLQLRSALIGPDSG